jgi:hypothetical protein
VIPIDFTGQHHRLNDPRYLLVGGNLRPAADSRVSTILKSVNGNFMRPGMNLKSIIALAVMIGLSSTPALAKKEKDKNKPLPQGLQMKLDRGGSLPPGWQKKLVKGEVLEEPIYKKSEVVIPVDSEGLLTVRVEGKLIRLIEATREIVDIVDLLNRS